MKLKMPLEALQLVGLVTSRAADLFLVKKLTHDDGDLSVTNRGLSRWK